MKEQIKSLISLAEAFTEISLDKDYPVGKWLQRFRVECHVCFPDENYYVKLGELTLDYLKDRSCSGMLNEWRIDGPAYLVQDEEWLNNHLVRYTTIYNSFVNQLPVLKKEYIQERKYAIERLEYSDLEQLKNLAA